MQGMKNKKLWFFLVLGVMILTTVCIWQSGTGKKQAYANGRIVQKQERGKVVRLPFESCNPATEGELGAEV